MSDERWMRHAMALAKKAETEGEVPVGAVIVKNGEIIGEGWNRSIKNHDASAHAEIVAMRDAGEQTGNYRLTDCELYVTLEPCSMCVGAMIHARVKRVIYSASDMRTGALGGALDLLHEVSHNHTFEVTSGVLEEECRELLQAFFRARR